MSTILIVILTLVILIILHELGHFLLAKRYGIKVEEFGIGIPPRAWGKKIGETVYSVNWIPLGGFVKLHGEDGKIDNERSFSSKPLYQRALTIFGGIAAFFIIAVIIFSLVALTGVRGAVGDDAGEEWANAQIFVVKIAEDSPADKAGIKSYDIIKKIDGQEVFLMEEVADIFAEKKGEEVDVLVERRGEELSFSIVPRLDYPKDEGAAGVAMLRTAEKKYPFYEAPIRGTLMTGEMTYAVLHGFYSAFSSFVQGKELPEYMEFGGPVAIVDIGTRELDKGFSAYLYFIGVITVSLAVLNALPIPALDGGRLMFLGIEKIKGEAIPQKVENGLNAAFFVLLLMLMIFITFKDLGL